MVPRINIKSLDSSTTYYTYDPWIDTGTTTKAVACSVNLSQNHQGVFTVVIEDETGAIDSNVNLGARVIVECGKQQSQMTRLISGLVRQKGYSRGGDRKRLITLSGSSTAIRLNEIITNQDIAARKLATDNLTIDTSDPNFVADLLLQNQLAGLSAEGVATASGISSKSDVESFIPSMTVNFGELQDVCNLIEEQTNGEIFVDISDFVQFRHQLQPFSSGKGFAIKNKYATNDNADDTMYLRGKGWELTESCLKSDGYSSRVYAVLAAQTPPSAKEDMGYAPVAGTRVEFGVNSTTQEVAQKFRPTHSHFLPGDFFIVGQQFGNGGSPGHVTFRICQDSGGLPLNSSGIVAQLAFPGSQNFENPLTAGQTVEKERLIGPQYFTNTTPTIINSFDLDTTKDYWLILSNLGVIANQGFSWAGKTVSGATGGRAIRTSGTASSYTNGGTGWALTSNGTVALFAIPRMRSQAFECADPKAIDAIGSGLSTGGTRIESTLSNASASIVTKEAMHKYLINQLYYMARPRANWNMATVTAPNVPIVPGDPIMISDSVLGFSTAGQQAVMTTCGDMTYSWQIGDYQAPTILSIQPVSNITRYN